MKTFLFRSALLVGLLFLAGMAPAWAGPIDLTTAGSSGSWDGVRFEQWNSETPAGTGISNAFVKWQDDRAPGAPDSNLAGDGVNTADRVLDSYNSPKDSDTLYTAFDTVDILGTTYRGLALDINEPASTPASKATQNPFLSVDDIQIWLGEKDLNYAQLATDATMVYDLDDYLQSTAGPSIDNWLLLDYGLSGQGSGRADMIMLVPDSYFTAAVAAGEGSYLYLYTQTGLLGVVGDRDYGDNGNPEEWGAATAAALDTFEAPPPVPEPASLLLMGAGLAGLATARRRKRRRTA